IFFDTKFSRFSLQAFFSQFYSLFIVSLAQCSSYLGLKANYRLNAAHSCATLPLILQMTLSSLLIHILFSSKSNFSINISVNSPQYFNLNSCANLNASSGTHSILSSSTSSFLGGHSHYLQMFLQQETQPKSTQEEAFISFKKRIECVVSSANKAKSLYS
ncbi:hypothetical protein IMG5_010680, partial [Ichthyophthirius multifiliis]